MQHPLMVATLAAAALVATTPVSAQVSSRITLGGTFGAVHVHGGPDDSAGELRGPTVGLDADARFEVLTVTARYTHAALEAETSTVPHTVVEGEVIAGLRPLRFLQVRVGPRIRSYILPEGTRRTVQWDVGMRLHTALVPGYARGFLAAWRALSGSVNAPWPLTTAHGGEGVLELTAPSLPGWLRLGYRLDRSAFADGRVETVEQAFVTAGFAVVR